MRKTVVILGALLAVDMSAVERPEERPVWAVREWRGAPGLWRDGEPVTPMVFWQWKPEPYEVEHFSAAGLSLFSFFGSPQHYDHRQRVQPLFLESVPA